jgi:transcriptional regulator GlxA family with amidase domain
MTPARAIDAIKVDAARGALEETDERMAQVARRCGFSDEDQIPTLRARAACASISVTKARSENLPLASAWRKVW